MLMIQINDFQIMDDGKEIGIDLSTTEGAKIVSVLLWTYDSFKNYSLAINLTDYLKQVDHNEAFIVKAFDIGIAPIKDICFIEVVSDAEVEEDCSNCSNSALGVAYELSTYYKCLVGNILKGKKTDCATCDTIENSNTKLALTVNLLIDSIIKSLTVGYFDYAISMLYDLQKLCDLDECEDCKAVKCNSCNDFKQF